MIVERWEGEKVDTNYKLRGGLSGLCVIFSIGTKKDPRGIAPRVKKQTDDSLKILSYGGEGVKQAGQPIQALGGRLRSVQELLSEQLDCLLEIPPGHFHR